MDSLPFLPKCLFLLLIFILHTTLFVKGRSLIHERETRDSGERRLSFETASFDDIQNSLSHLTPNQLSILINHRAAAAVMTSSSSDSGNSENHLNHLPAKFDYNISKLLYSMGDSCFVEVWKYFQPDDHVHNNEAFSIAIMDFVSRYFGFELSRWLSFTVQLETIRDQRIQKYMGLGLRDSQISGSSNSLYEPRNLLNDLISSAGGNSDVFSRRKSICQRVLMFAGDNFKVSIEKMPSLFSCATVKEITEFFADGTQSTKRLQIVKQQMGSLTQLQKDALVRQLNQVQNTFVKWRTTTQEVESDLCEFDFFQTTHSSSSRRSQRWTLSEGGGGGNLIKLPYLARVQKTEPHAKWATLLLQLFSEDTMRDAMAAAFFHDELQQVMQQISEQLCSEFTIYQRALLSKVLEAFFKTNPLDQTGWSKEEQERFSCFLKLHTHSQTSNDAVNIKNSDDKDSFYNPHPNSLTKGRPNVDAAPKNRSGQDWNSIESLDRIFELLFFNSSQIRTRSEAVQVVRAIRREFLRSHGTSLNSISELSRHQLNAIPAFVLREFWTSEFNFNSGRNFELCRESFIRVGSIDNSDLSARKRSKLVNIFMEKCKNVFEDNLRVLNSLVCDWSFSSSSPSTEVLSEHNKKQQWISRSRDCRITNEAFAVSLWNLFQNDSLQELLFTLGPNNLCTVLPNHFWDEVAIDANHFDRLLWTLLKIDAAQRSHTQSSAERETTRKCLQKIVPKLKNSMDKKIELFKYESTIPCQDILILKHLNKYLSADLLTTAAAATSAANKNERRVEDYYSSCLNLIGSHSQWFSETQLINFVNRLQSEHWQVFTTTERVDHPQLDGLLVFWKMSNLIPYLNSTSIKSLLLLHSPQIHHSTTGTGTATSTTIQHKSPQHEQEAILAFLANLRWKVKSENSEAARQVLEHFRLSLHTKTVAEKVAALNNIVCSLPNYQSAQQLQSLLSTMYYCTEEGVLKKSGMSFERNLAGSYLLMDSQNVQLKQTLSIHGKVVDNVDKIPDILVKANFRQIVEMSSLDEISIEQASYLLSEMNQSEWSTVERATLLAIVDSDELIEEKEEATDLNGSEMGEESANNINNDQGTGKGQQKIDFSYSQEVQEGASMIRRVEIIYITATATKLQVTNSLILLLSVATLLLKTFI